mmetsp:Transcript_511/g.1106  ORF Transcript_511/g.1106 Transcript_511/m.1106 type:complete len:99 (+) Transcript_511:167-463(+)|eukprot:CAMPEP_0201131432 /NCGR_PEP_ID=MMETSP0850-20130426/42808_1 /ASSEMBLY_ACC=CAM_ASM_000622 /TAXON_ID=183588 /ORGANISM="Pseudo-nitzschia fraudulenta, Strain WWA7" /LENGTH=98 /DNA_ID=CAMNT_0047401471 /DNA_START=91 /DNA_END=387 /DNA_ORIENTATION=+
MVSVRFVCSLLLVAIASRSSAFTPSGQISRRTSTSLNGLLDGQQERQALTRDSEPEEFFSTNTDKMSDEEKIPIALAGLAGISLPFIFGLIALYAAQG